MRLGKATVAIAVSLSLVGQASAATVTADGSALVNQGQGFRPLAPGQNINPGDSILLKSGANARISFPGGCAMSMPTEGVYTVPTESQCQAAQQQAQAQTTTAEASAGSAETAGASGNLLTPTNLLIGGLALGGIVAGVVVLNDNNKSSSP